MTGLILGQMKSSTGSSDWLPAVHSAPTLAVAVAALLATPTRLEVAAVGATDTAAAGGAAASSAVRKATTPGTAPPRVVAEVAAPTVVVAVVPTVVAAEAAIAVGVAPHGPASSVARRVTSLGTAPNREWEAAATVAAAPMVVAGAATTAGRPAPSASGTAVAREGAGRQQPAAMERASAAAGHTARTPAPTGDTAAAANPAAITQCPSGGAAARQAQGGLPPSCLPASGGCAFRRVGHLHSLPQPTCSLHVICALCIPNAMHLCEWTTG